MSKRINKELIFRVFSESQTKRELEKVFVCDKVRFFGEDFF